MPPPHPRFRIVFSAFCVGLFANVVLPGRVGELARVAVLARRMPERQGDLGDADRLRLRAPRCSTSSRRSRSSSGCCFTAEAAALGGDELVIVARGRLRAVHVRVDDARGASNRTARRARHGPDAARARRGSGSRVMRAPLPAATAAALPVPRLAVPARRGLGDDARVRHPRAARGRRARARADERRDDLPALAREHRPRPGGGRAAARRSTASPTRAASRSGSASRRSRRRSASGSG